MKLLRIATLLLACGGAVLADTSPSHSDATTTSAPDGADPELTAFIGKIRAVDNHSHANSVAPGDALPLDGIFPFEVPVQLRPDNSDWLAAYKALYKYPHTDMSEAHLNEVRGTMQHIAKEQGDKFPAWVLDQVGTEVLLANRVTTGPGLEPPRSGRIRAGSWPPGSLRRTGEQPLRWRSPPCSGTGRSAARAPRRSQPW
jgi:hypothetical protein